MGDALVTSGILLTLVSMLAPILDDRPPASDLNYFPTLEVVTESLRANREFLESLESRQRLFSYRYWDYQTCINETNELYRAWQALLWAHQWSLPEHKRDQLKELRERIGPEWYYAGAMPACVPLWRCERIEWGK